ncbi:MAG: SgcJ/EcaC family oxidoreductase [Kiritimatiellae bacterium]|nr:SgcJ/EcaC family oxidoreductase [Kiritimatiellia bacterium]
MRRRERRLAGWLCILAGVVACAQTPEVAGGEAEVAALFDQWDAALRTGDPDTVVALYAEDAVLLPTLSGRVRVGPEGIRDYFVHFLEKQPAGVITESHLRRFGDLAIRSGLYTFTLTDPDGIVREVDARFTFVYRLQDGRWRIVEHHSSLRPES